METSVRDGEQDEAKGGRIGGGRDVKPGSRLHLICDSFMALYKDKWDIRQFKRLCIASKEILFIH